MKPHALWSDYQYAAFDEGRRYATEQIVEMILREPFIWAGEKQLMHVSRKDLIEKIKQLGESPLSLDT